MTDRPPRRPQEREPDERPEKSAPSVDARRSPATSRTVSDPATTDAGSAVEPGQTPPAIADGSSGTDDASDVAAALRGEDVAFARLYDRHAAIVLAVCRRSTPGSLGDAAEADDALQETFIRAHRQLATLDAPHRFRSWLLGIARHVCSERRRASGRRRRHEETAMTMRTTEAEGRRRDADEVVASAEALDRLGAALDHLPEAERLAIHLYYLDSDPVRAANDELGLSRSGFYKLLGRARDHLRALLADALGDSPVDPLAGRSAEGGQTT